MSKRSKRHDWIGRQGHGPLMVVPEGLMEAWHGKFDDSYDELKSMDDYLALLPIGDGQALVLGDEPFETTWLPTPKTGGGMFVRRLWSNSTADAIAAANMLGPEDWTFEEGTIEVPSGRLVLFDAVHPGDAPRASLNVELAPGRYAVATADASPDEETCIMAHRLFPLE